MNIPENWIVIELPSGLRKVFATWRGGYVSSDEWRLNSGIVDTLETADYYDFVGSSGSVYRCHKHLEGVSGIYLIGVANSIIEKTQAKIINYGEQHEDTARHQ